jgi:hypothetical protein
MKKLLFVLGWLTISQFSFGQVQNGGFENYSNSPSCASPSIVNCTNWTGVNFRNVSPPTFTGGANSGVTYFHRPLTNNCFTGQTGSVAHSGNAMAQFHFRGNTGGVEYREFVQQSITLTAGKKYKIISFFDDGACACISTTSNNRKIGFKLLPSSVGITAQQIINAAQNESAHPFISPTIGAPSQTGWEQATAYFVPTVSGTYFLLIGSFLWGDDSPNTLNSLFVDDVSVVETCDGVTGTATTSRTIVCPVNPSATLTLSGYTGNIQWQYAGCNGIWGNISNATSFTCPVTPPEAENHYRAAVYCNGSYVYSNVLNIGANSNCGNTSLYACGGGSGKKSDGSIENGNSISAIDVYPNPTSGQFMVSTLFEDATEFTITVLDLLGKKVYEEQVLSSKGSRLININMGNYSKGIYSVKVVSRDENKIFKVIYQ